MFLYPLILVKLNNTGYIYSFDIDPQSDSMSGNNQIGFSKANLYYSKLHRQQGKNKTNKKKTPGGSKDWLLNLANVLGAM